MGRKLAERPDTGRNDHEKLVVVDCHSCHGSGYANKSKGIVCSSCHGSGKAVRIVHSR